MNKVTEKSKPRLSTVGGRIENERRIQGISQQELADKLSIQRQKISYIEQDIPNRKPTIYELGQIADALNVSTDYLLGRVSSKNTSDIDISKITGLNNESIDTLKNIHSSNRSGILNSFLCSSNLEEFTKILEQYLTIKYITEVLFSTPFSEIEKNYKSKQEVIATKENIGNLKSFIRCIDKIRYDKLQDFEMFAFTLHSNERELHTISKMCTDLEDSNGKWDSKKQGTFDFKVVKKLKDKFNSFKSYYLFILLEQNLIPSIEKLGKKVLQDKNIHIELKILNNE